MIVFLCAIGVLASSVCNNDPLEPYWFSQYAQAPTDGTMEYRQSVGDIPMDMSAYDGVIAVEDCAKVGHEALINVDNQWRKVIAFDCLARNEHNWMQEKNIVAELGYYLARLTGTEVGSGVQGNLIWVN